MNRKMFTNRDQFSACGFEDIIKMYWKDSENYHTDIVIKSHCSGFRVELDGRYNQNSISITGDSIRECLIDAILGADKCKARYLERQILEQEKRIAELKADLNNKLHTLEQTNKKLLEIKDAEIKEIVKNG